MTQRPKFVLPWPIVISEVVGFLLIILGYLDIKQSSLLPAWLSGTGSAATLIIVGLMLMLPAGLFLVSGWFGQLDSWIKPTFGHSAGRERKKKEHDDDTDH